MKIVKANCKFWLILDLLRSNELDLRSYIKENDITEIQKSKRKSKVNYCNNLHTF